MSAEQVLYSQGEVRPGVVSPPFYGPSTWRTRPRCWDDHGHLEVSTHDSPLPGEWLCVPWSSPPARVPGHRPGCEQEAGDPYCLCFVTTGRR